MARENTTGILLEDHLVEWVSLGKGKQGRAVADTLRLPLEMPDPELLGDPDADVVPVEAQIRTACSKIKGGVSIALPTTQVLTRVVTLPVVPDDELADMVELQVDKLAPFPIESLTISHEVVHQREDTQQVLIGAVRTQYIEELGERLEGAGVTSVRVDLAAMGLCRVLADSGELGEEGRQVVITLDEAGGQLLVLQNGYPLVIRTLALPEGDGGEAWLSFLEDEIAYTLTSLEVEHGASRRNDVHIWSLQDLPHSLPTDLSQRCGCECKLHATDALPPVAEGTAQRLIDWDGTGMDLTPRSWIDGRERRIFRRRMIGAASAVFGVWLLATVGLLGGVYYQKSVIKDLDKELKRTNGPAREVKDIKKRIDLIRTYTERDYSALECLREVSVLLPEGVLLLSYTYRKNELVKISGEATAPDAVYDYKKALDKSELFEESKLGPLRYDPKRRKRIFDIDLKLPATELLPEEEEA